MSHYLLEHSLFDAKTVKKYEQQVVASGVVTEFDLMSAAGACAYAELCDAFGTPTGLHIFCGSGNNGGDGYVIAQLAAADGIPVIVYEFGSTEKLSAEAKAARQLCVDRKVSFSVFSLSTDLSEGIIVDSLLGTGLKGPLRDQVAEAIECINSSMLPVLAVDIPSGLCADTGNVDSIAVRADITITFIAAKQGLFTGRGPALCGDVVYDSLDVDQAILQQNSPSTVLMSLEYLIDFLPELAMDGHKYQRGHCMVVGGDYGCGGAAILAAQSSLVTGAGVTSLATREQHITACLTRQPEIMACGVASGQQLEPLLAKPSVLVLGPGLGQSSWSEQLFQKAMAANLPTVVDADGLNILAQGRVVSDFSDRRWVLTPHAGEAARLLGVSITEIERDRFAAVRNIQEKYSAVVVLKGPGSLVLGVNSKTINICPYGNPAMATAGMGDLLSGIIGGLLAQGLDLDTAAELGCCLHGLSADSAVDERGDRGFVASDILEFLPMVLNQQADIDGE
jgi:NAD(P)H-hydrate epimerase